jgi:hypothetical protein
MKSKNLPAVAALVATLTFGQAALAPRQSHAIVAVATGGAAAVPLIVFGAGALSTTAGLAIATPAGVFYGTFFLAQSPAILFKLPALGWGTVLTWAGLGALLTGLIMLDETGAPSPDFQPLSDAEIDAAHILPEEARAHDRQLDRINSVSESLARDLAELKLEDPNEALRYVAEGWAKACNGGMLNKRACAAVVKRGALALRKAQEAAAIATSN